MSTAQCRAATENPNTHQGLPRKAREDDLHGFGGFVWVQMASGAGNRKEPPACDGGSMSEHGGNPPPKQRLKERKGGPPWLADGWTSSLDLSEILKDWNRVNRVHEPVEMDTGRSKTRPDKSELSALDPGRVYIYMFERPWHACQSPRVWLPPVAS